MYQQLQRERLPRRRKCLCAQTKELRASIRRRVYPVCEDADSKDHCLFRFLPNSFAMGSENQDLSSRLKVWSLSLSWGVKNSDFFSPDSLGSLCSLRKKKIIQNKSRTAPELMATSPCGGSRVIWVRWSAIHARVPLFSNWNWEEQRDTSKLKPHSLLMPVPQINKI